MRSLLARISTFALVTLLVVTGTALGGVSFSGVPAGISFVGSNCCDQQSDEQESEQDAKLESACCCRPTPFAELMLQSPPAISRADEQGLSVPGCAEVNAHALLGLRLDTRAVSARRARAPPPPATSLYTQHTSLLL